MTDEQALKVEASKLSPPVLRPWHPEWWIPSFGPQQRAECIERIATGANPDASYYVLIILSTLIASYGLLSNSTATVIGAMIVAPLMGPILGLAMGTVLGDTRMFRRSLVAEVSGVILVILTGMLVAQLTGVTQIDFSASEIANRTRPTLYDLAIGLAAGLAGAFCLLHPGLQAGVAGVAIAVALVPPLSVTGITLAGWLQGDLSWRPAFGSFMLFFANFLTIELAAGLLFTAMGFRLQQQEHTVKEFRRAVSIQLVLLLITGIFLSGQLASLVRERIGLSISRKAVRSALLDIPGADLDNLKAELTGSELSVKAVVGSRTELTPKQVREMEVQIQKALEPRLKGVHVHLIARTVSSTYASASGFLYEPQNAPPSPEQIRSQQLGEALQELLSKYPGVELSGFQPLLPSRSHEEFDTFETSRETWPVELTLRSPYPFTPNLVKELQDSLNSSIESHDAFEKKPLKLVVRTVSVSTATALDTVAISAPTSESQADPTEYIDTLISQAARRLWPKAQIQVSSRHRSLESSGEEEHFSSKLQIAGDSFLDESQVISLRDEVIELFEKARTQKLILSLDVDSRLVRNIIVDESSRSAFEESRLLNEFYGFVHKARAHVDEASVSTSLSNDMTLQVKATVYSEKYLTNGQVLAWQKQLKAQHPELTSVELKLENRLGRSLKLAPSRE